MSLLWELFQEYQIGKRRTSHDSLEQVVTEQDEEIAGLCDIVGEMAKRIDELEAQVYGEQQA
jgi:hypothetical protein